MDKRKRRDNMEGELLRRKQKMKKNIVGGSNNICAATNSTVHDGGGGVDDLVLIDILIRLPVKSLMRFKSVCKHWRSTIQQEYFIDLYNARSEARQCVKNNNGTTTTTLLLAPVKVCGEKQFRDSLGTNEEAGTELKVISFSHNNQGGSSDCAPVHSIHSNITLPVSRRKDPLELVSFNHTSILEPVHGLVCFVNLEDYGSVQIYNPSTRDKSPWIRTRTSIILEDIFVEQKETQEGLSQDMYEWRTFYSCMFGFGMDSTTKKHKVLCIYQVDMMELTGFDEEYPVYENHSRIYCEVMTVGENIWRDIDCIPPNLEVGEQDKSVHANGCIYWMRYRDESEPCLKCKNDVIMAFDLGSETFREILIPTFIVENLCRLDSHERQYKWTNELLDVDGNIAILDLEEDNSGKGDQCGEGRQWINLWIYDKEMGSTLETGNPNAIAGSDACWIKETLPLSYCWEELKYLAIKAISGTNLILTKFFRNSCPLTPTKLESLECYDRKKKKVCGKQLNMISDNTRLYDITTLFETLTPVQTGQHKLEPPRPLLVGKQ